MRRLGKLLMSSVLVFLFALPAFAADDVSKAELKELLKTTRALQVRVEQLEKRLQQYEAKEKQASETKKDVEDLKKETAELSKIKDALSHIELSGGVTGVVQGTANNEDNPPNYGNTTDAAFSTDLNLATHFGKYGNFYIHLEGGDGAGMQNDVNSFSVPDYDAYDTTNHFGQSDLTISEAFYEFNLLNDRVTLDAGKMDISVLFDENDVAGDETTQFMSNIFVKSMGLTIPEPDDFYCPAFMVKVDPVDLLEFRVIGASVEANQKSEWERVFDHGFLAWQVNVRPKFRGRQGNYRFYGWWDDRNHLDDDDLAIANTNPSYRDPLADEEQMGWGLSFDQEIINGIKGFARYSQTEDDLANWNGDDQKWEIIPFDRAWSIGMEIPGNFWRRSNDVVGIAYGQTILTDDYRDANPEGYSSLDDENYVEAYYKLVLHERFAVSGDLQWINNAGGDGDADDIYIFGLRTQLDF